MIKIVKVLAWIWATLLLFFFITIVVVSNIGPNSNSPVVAGIYDGVCNVFCSDTNQTLGTYELGYIFGSSFLFPFIAFGFLLTALYTKKRIYYQIAYIVFILILLSSIGNGGLNFGSLLFVILLSTNPVRRFFKKEPA